MKARQPNIMSSRDVRNRQGEASTICLLLPFNTFYICSVAKSDWACQVWSFCFYCWQFRSGKIRCNAFEQQMYPHRKNSLVPDFRRMAALTTGLGLGFMTDPVPSTSCLAWFCIFAVDLHKIQSQGDTSQNTSLKKSWWVQTFVFWM